MKIRRATSDDCDLILYFIKQLAIYEKEPDQAKATHEQIQKSFFCENPNVFCEIVENDEEKPVGFAVWFLNYSTWQGVHGIYLEDLFILEEYRGRGYGKGVLKYLANICKENGYGRFQWWCLKWNEPSIEFYKSIGAIEMSEWTTFRVCDQALEDLAK